MHGYATAMRSSHSWSS